MDRSGNIGGGDHSGYTRIKMCRLKRVGEEYGYDTRASRKEGRREVLQRA
ncbi:hypothetical protein ES705_19275 [subsurface metagenome]